MKFSIITCTWNSEPYLAESISSVLAQDYPDIEYIFVDGGSTDGTLDRIRSLRRPYTLLENVRGGIGRAMNEGARVATGDVIHHLHGDDYYLHSGVLSEVAKRFETTGADWVVGRFMRVRNGSRTLDELVQRDFSFSRLLNGSFFCPHQSTFVSGPLFKSLGGFNENLRYAMDLDLWLRIGLRHRPALVEGALGVFREHAGSTSTSSVEAILKARQEELGVRMQYFGRAPFAAATYYARHLVRTRRLRKAQP